jgi:hypothetical protein
MSEVPKAVEQQAAPVEPTPTVESATEAKTEEAAAPVAGETAAASEPAKDVVEPAAPAEAPAKAAAPKKEFTGEGFLGYKAPGGIIK